jgi:ATP-binding cassette subfamily B multidrug efflux pump
MGKMFSYLKPYRLWALAAPLTMVGEVTADLLLPYLMSFIVNYGIAGIDVRDAADGSPVAAALLGFFRGASYSRMDIIVTFGLLMLAVTLLGGVCGVSCAYFAAHAAQSMGNDLRCDAYRHVMSLSIQQTDQFTTGSLITRMTNDIAMVVEFMEMFMRGFVRAPMFVIGGTILLLTLDLSFGMVLLCTMPILLLTLWLVLSRAIPMYGILQQKLDKVNSVVQENVSGARVVKAYVREDYECGRFGRANTELCAQNERVLKLMAVIPPVLTLLLNGSVIAVLYLGGADIRAGIAGMTTGAVMAAVTYVTQIMQAITMVTNLFQSISRATASAERINEVLAVEPALVAGSETAQAAPAAVQFDHVSFQYPGAKGRPVLQDISLTVRRGEMLAVIGATGCGKSTLLSLIPRFYDADAGAVRIDGLPVQQYDLEKLRAKIGYVMQKSELFSDTLAGNIRWGRPDASDADVAAAAETAQASGFIAGFAERFDTFVAEKGASLSGGQKQRISIARALVRRPEILILDDATSALDLETEARLRAALKEKLTGTTVILVAQRIASVREADRIAVMENDGTIRYCAPHDELMRTCETYRSIYESQQRAAHGDAPVPAAAGKAGAV